MGQALRKVPLRGLEAQGELAGGGGKNVSIEGAAWTKAPNGKEHGTCEGGDGKVAS